MSEEIQTWQQGGFIDKPQYRNMGEEWKEERRYEESLVVRPSPEGNAICKTNDPEMAKWIAQRLNRSAELEEKIRSLIPKIHGGGNARRMLESLLSNKEI